MGNSLKPEFDSAQLPTINTPAFQEWLRQRQSVSGETDAPVLSSGAALSSGSGNSSGSGGGGYGLALIAADEASQERIRAIMRDLCEKEKARGGAI